MGKVPEREFRERSSVSRDLIAAMEGGKAPENELTRRIKVFKLGRNEREEGIGP